MSGYHVGIVCTDLLLGIGLTGHFDRGKKRWIEEGRVSRCIHVCKEFTRAGEAT